MTEHPHSRSDTLRAAMQDRRAALPGYIEAMKQSPAWVQDALTRYVAAIQAEAAAYRVEAKSHRLRLEEITRTTPMERDTEEDA